MIRKSTFSILTIAIITAGCGSNPAKDIKEARNDEVEAERKQHEEHAEIRQEQTEESAKERYERAKETHEKLPPETQARADAEARMVEQREIYRSKATERLEKANARIAEAQQKINNARSVPLDTRNRLQAAAAQRDAVRIQIQTLPTASDEQIRIRIEEVDKALDQLDQLVERAEESANKL